MKILLLSIHGDGRCVIIFQNYVQQFTASSLLLYINQLESEFRTQSFLFLNCMKNGGLQGVELNGASKHFMAFGGGMRFCVGTDFTKVQMAVFLHCLVTKYRWKTIKGGNIVRTPGLQFPDGFYIQLKKKDTRKQETTLHKQS